MITNDGVSIAREIELSNPLKNMGAHSSRATTVRPEPRAAGRTSSLAMTRPRQWHCTARMPRIMQAAQQAERAARRLEVVDVDVEVAAGMPSSSPRTSYRGRPVLDARDDRGGGGREAWPGMRAAMCGAWVNPQAASEHGAGDACCKRAPRTGRTS